MARRNLEVPEDANPVAKAVRRLEEVETEVMRCYRPATWKQLEIHQAREVELVIRGGKRSSKSTCGFIEAARRWTGRPIYANTSEPSWIPSDEDVALESPFPIPTKSDPQLYWIIGWDLKHIGQTVFRILFEEAMGGPFRVIPDEDTGCWRTYNQVHDKHRYSETRPAAPLIPSHLIDEGSWVWDNSAGGKAGNIFREVTLTNGAKICTYPSSAKAPKQGDPVSGLLIDEDIQNPSFLAEYQDRLADRDGWFIWTAWPHIANNALRNLIRRASEEKDDPDCSIRSVQLLMSENPFITEKAKRNSFRRMGDAESIARRDRGDLLENTMAMYDFSDSVHGIDPPTANSVRLGAVDKESRRGVIQSLFHDRGGLPDDFTRYVAIDPSHTRTAVIVGAVPPPEFNGTTFNRCVILEHEMVLKRATADILARELAAMLGSRRIEAFIMDRRMGQQTRVGSDVNVFQTYGDAFARHRLVSRLSGSSFIPGCDKLQKRYMAVRSFLAGPDVFLLLGRMRETLKEIQSYWKKQTVDKHGEEVLVDEPVNPRKFDCMAAMEYLLAFLEDQFSMGVAYVSPEQYGSTSGIVRAADAIKKSQLTETAGDYVHWGPGLHA